jgi:hypothetical protein
MVGRADDEIQQAEESMLGLKKKRVEQVPQPHGPPTTALTTTMKTTTTTTSTAWQTCPNRLSIHL